MKTSRTIQTALTLFVFLLEIAVFAPMAGAQTTYTKDANTSPLNTDASWLGTGVPNNILTDIARWDSNVGGANSSALGGDLSWLGMQITNPGGSVTITATANATLTLGASGIDASTYTTGSLSISAPIVLSASQTWTFNTGNPTFSSTVNNGGNTLTVAGAFLRFSGNLTGSGGLTKNGAGQIEATGNLTYTGDTTINSGPFYIGQGGATGSISSSSLVTGGGTGNLAFFRTTDFSFANTIVGGIAVNKYSADTVTITGTNTYTGKTSINNGALSVSSLNSVGVGGRSSLGAPINATNGTIAMGSGTTTGQLTYTGSGETTDRVISLAGTTGGATIDQSGAGLLKFTSAMTAAGGGSKLLTLQGSTAGTGEIAGVIVDNSGLNKTSLTKAGTGTWTLSGNNTYTGATTISAGTLQLGNGGTTGKLATTGVIVNNANLTINRSNAVAQGTDFSAAGITGTGSFTQAGSGTTTLNAANAYTGATMVNSGMLTLNRQTGSLAATTALTMGGGTFNMDNVGASGALSQSLGALTFNAGDGTVKTTRTAAQDQAITFSSLAARTAGATGNFVNGGGTNGAANGFVLTGATADAFIDKGIFYGGSAYAWNDATGFVRAISYGSDAGAVTSGATTTLASATHQQITGAISAQDNATFTTLNISGNNNLTLNATQTVTVDGILKSGDTAGGATISGGSGIQAATNAELVIRTDGANDALTISSPILANGSNALTKSGAGTLTLSGANTYTGTTTVNAGTLAYGANDVVLSGDVTVAGGTLALSTFSDTVGAVTLSNGSITSTTGVLTGTSYSLTDTGSVSAILAGTAALTKTGAGTATLTGVNTYTGTTTVNAGTLAYGVTNALSSGDVTVAGGTLALSTFSDTVGAVTLSSGSITSSTGVLTGTSYNLTDSGSVSAILAGTAALTKTGAGTATLTGANTYSGGTTVTVGTLVLAHNSAAGSAGVTLSGASSSTLQINSGVTITNNITFSNTNSGSSVSRLVANATAYTVGTSGNLTSTFSGGQADTTATILAGTNAQGSTATLAMKFSDTSAASNDGVRKSDIFSLSGTSTDLFALQLNVTGLDTDSFLGWLNGGSWVNAVSGNSGNNASGAQQGYLGSFSAFQGTYGTTLSAYVGAYGVDTTGGSTWAVLNHNSDYAAIPESSTWALLAFSLTTVMVLRRRRMSNRP